MLVLHVFLKYMQYPSPSKWSSYSYQIKNKSNANKIIYSNKKKITQSGMQVYHNVTSWDDYPLMEDHHQ